MPFIRNITIGYQEVHPTLINENDRLLIDCSESVRVYAMTIAYRQGKYDVTADRLNIDLESLSFRQLMILPYQRQYYLDHLVMHPYLRCSRERI